MGYRHVIAAMIALCASWASSALALDHVFDDPGCKVTDSVWKSQCKRFTCKGTAKQFTIHLARGEVLQYTEVGTGNSRRCEMKELNPATPHVVIYVGGVPVSFPKLTHAEVQVFFGGYDSLTLAPPQTKPRLPLIRK